MARINLLGHGKIMQAMAKILAPCDIYDDKFSEISFDEFGNRLLPSKEIVKIAESNKNSPSLAEGARGWVNFTQVAESRLDSAIPSPSYLSNSHISFAKRAAPPAPLPLRAKKLRFFAFRGRASLSPLLAKNQRSHYCSLAPDFLHHEAGEFSGASHEFNADSANLPNSQNLMENHAKIAESANKSQQTIEAIAVEVVGFLDDFGRKARLKSAQCPKSSKSPQDAPKSKLQTLDSVISIISPGIPPHSFLAQNAPNIISEYDFFASQMPPSVWISGTNGKTTTTQMTALLLQDFGAQSGGNIGTPLCKMDFNAPLWVLETSSFMLHYTNIATPKIYALLPIEADHLSWHGDFERYVEAKLKPLKTMSAKSHAIIPKIYADSALCADFKGKIYFYEDAQNLAKIFDIKSQNLRFRGAFLLDSILALAICALVTGKIDYDLMNSFQIDAHKIEEFFDAQKRLFIDDSKATNISATIEALKIYKEKFIFLILGGDNKGVSLAPLVAILRDFRVKVFAIGACENHIKDLCAESSVPCEVCGDLQNAVAKIKSEFNDAKNQVCLLSPACASLDQFKSYAERGELFKKYALAKI